MKATVIGGTGLIGSQVVDKLSAAGNEAVPAALSTGVDLISGKGLDQALESSQVAVNVANSPTFDDASLGFFRASMTNLLAAGQRAGIRHQVILSIVGVDQVPELDYYRAKALQEDLLREGPTPYSIVRATQFFEFMDAVLDDTSDDTTVRLPSTPIQPIAAADVVDAVVEVSSGPPLEGIWNVAGPDAFHLDELGRMTLAAQHDNRRVVTDDRAGMFAAAAGDVLIPGPDAHLAPTHYQDWLQRASRLRAQPARLSCPRAGRIPLGFRTSGRGESPDVSTRCGPVQRALPEEGVEPGFAPVGEVNGQQLPAIAGHLVHVDCQGFGVVRTLSAEVLELRHAPEGNPALGFAQSANRHYMALTIAQTARRETLRQP
jgi:uncharacterized protein YbjT (DUF2867 family)